MSLIRCLHPKSQRATESICCLCAYGRVHRKYTSAHNDPGQHWPLALQMAKDFLETIKQRKAEGDTGERWKTDPHRERKLGRRERKERKTEFTGRDERNVARGENILKKDKERKHDCRRKVGK